MKGMRWGLIAGLMLVLSIAQAATKEKPQFYLGVSREVVLATLGKPDAKVPPDFDGKELWTYGRALVTFVAGKVVSWKYFNEVTPEPSANARPLGLGSTQEEVAAQLGFPPAALRYSGLVIGQKPIGEEEWTYTTGTFIFKDGLVVGWRNVSNPAVSLGKYGGTLKKVDLGASAKELVAGMGTPPTLTCYVKSGDQLWNYVQVLYLLRGGKVIWAGTPQAKTAAERPPVIEDRPATGETTTAATEERGFINDPEFATFRVAFQPTLDRMLQANPNLSRTMGYRAMQDCLSQRAWWSIQAQADIDEDYAKGVDTIEEEYNKYLDSMDR
ncbi:MAG: hypothetical protein ACYDCO_03485 [Armatimonadota bacterium]